MPTTLQTDRNTSSMTLLNNAGKNLLSKTVKIGPVVAEADELPRARA